MNKAKFLILALLSLAGLWCQAATVNVRDLGAKGNGVDDDWLAFRDAFNRAVSDGSVTVTVPSGTYVIGQPLVIYSNTTLNLASDATIRPKDASVIGLLRGQHMLANGKPCPMDSSCTHGGYTQLKNVTINGGVWDLNTATGADVTYIMHLWHGENIKVTNLTCKGNLNHYLNFSGSKDVLVENVTFLPSTDHPYVRPPDEDEAAAGEGWSAREAIHLDFITAAGEAGAYPLDATPCKDITVRSCKFSGVVAGIGTHRHFEESGASETIANVSERIIVTNCVFESMMSYAVSMFYFKDSVIAGNRVTTASGIPAAGFRLVGKSTVTVENNNLSSIGSHAISLETEPAEALEVTIQGNTIDTTGENGIYADGDDTGAMIYNNRISNAGKCGVQIYGGEYDIYSNEISGAKSHGISVTSGADVLVRGNTIANAKDHGIYAGGSSVVDASGNTISKSGKNAIHAEEGADFTVKSNTISEPTGYGICALTRATVTSSYNEINKAKSSAIYIFGAGECTFDQDDVVSPRNMGVQVDSSRCVLQDVLISGAASHAVSVSGAAEVDVNNCDITSCSGHAFVVADSGTKLVVNGASVEGATGNGVTVDTGASAEICDSVFEGIAQHGIVCQNGAAIVADGNMFTLSESSGQKCVFASGASVCNLAGNVFKGSQSTVGALHIVSGSSSTRIIDNRIVEPAYRGIRLESMSGGTVDGNIIDDPAREGIDVVSCSRLTISGNEITGLAYPAGIRVQGSGTKNITLSGNVVASDSAYDIRIDECSGCTATGNACVSAGFSSAATGVTGLEYAPGDAPIVSAKRVAENVVEVEWFAPANATGYLVDIALNPEFTRATTREIRDPATTSTRFDGLYPERDYYVRVRTKETYNGSERVSSGDPAFARQVGEDMTFICSDYEEGVRIEGVTTGFYTCIDIPDEIDGKPVVAIGDAAFSDCDHAATVSIPDSVREIGAGVFKGCPEKMFDTTTKPGLKLADGWVVGYDEDLGETLDLAGLRGVADYVFQGCDSLKTVNVPETFGNLGVGAWSRCTSLRSINFAGDAPECLEDVFYEVPEACYGYVKRYSRGWGAVPGEWNNLKIAYPEWSVSFNPVGTAGAEIEPVAVANGAAAGALPVPVAADDSLEFAGWYTQPGGKGEAVTATTRIFDDTEVFATWTAAAPRVWKTASVEGGVAIRGSEGGGGALVIPASINGKQVVAIADYAFFGNKDIRSASIPDSVKTIGIKAFKGCSNLASVSMPARLTTLGQAAFQDCTSLTEFDVPAGIDYLWSSTFEGCLALQRVSLPEGITAIGTSSFANCKALIELNIPRTVKTVKSFAFFSCESLPAVTLPANLVTIEQKAFKNCVSLPSIAIPSSVKTLGKAAFFNSGLVEATVPGNVALVDDYCFQKCAALKKMTLAEGVQKTGSSVWANDDALTEVVFPKSLKTLGAYAFFRCSKLAKLTNFSSLSALSTLGEKTFKHCTSLKSLTMPSQVTNLPKEMCNYCAKLETVSGTKNVTSIGQSAFSNCPALKSIAGLDASALTKVKRGSAWQR